MKLNKPGASNAKFLAAVVVVVAVAAIALTAVQPGLFALPEKADIGTFTDSGNAIETVDGKPVIRLFSTTWCPHCQWISETYDSVVQEYVAEGKIVAYHWELDTEDNTLTPEKEIGVPSTERAVFEKFSPNGGVPTFVFGGRYHRVGNGYERQDDLAAEEAEFRAVIEALLEETG